MRLFVTGAGGYIGSAVVRAAREAQHDVVGLVRSDKAAADLRALGCGVVVGDLADLSALVPALTDVDAVVHTAVGAGGGLVTEQDHVAVATMLDALRGRPAAFTLTSGLAVYTGFTGGLIDEDTPLTHASPVQQPRIALEHRVVAAAGGDLRTAVIRPAHVYGQGRSGIFTRMLLEASAELGAGVYVGDGTGMFATVHVDDLAAAYVELSTVGMTTPVVNVLGQSLPMREIAQAMGEAIGAAGRTTSLALEEATARWGPRAAVLLGTPPVSSVRATTELRWWPAHPTLAYELIHGTLRPQVR